MDKVAKQSYAMTGKAIHCITTAHQPHFKSQYEITSARISLDVSSALIQYKTRRILHTSHWHDNQHGNYYAQLAKDTIKFLWQVIWAWFGAMLFSLMTTILYIVINLAILGLSFYMLFII